MRIEWWHTIHDRTAFFLLMFSPALAPITMGYVFSVDIKNVRIGALDRTRSSLSQAGLGQVSLGQAVEVTVDAYDQVFQGEVSHITSRAEFTPSNVQTKAERVHLVFAVQIRLPNPDGALKPGMPADAIFRGSGGS